MPDIFIDVGPMSYSKDTTKVAVKYATNAQTLMRDAMKASVTATPGFTLVMTKDITKGYTVNLTLAEISFLTVQGMPGVKASFTGDIFTYPGKLLVTQALTGSGTIGGDTSDGAVRDAIKEGVKATMQKSVFPTLKRL